MPRNPIETVRPTTFNATKSVETDEQGRGWSYRTWLYPLAVATFVIAIILLMTLENNPFGSATIVYDPPDSDLRENTDRPSTQTSDEELATPFQSLALERARESSIEILDQFGKYQDYVETHKLGLNIPKHRRVYEGLIDRMHDADRVFEEERFDEALDLYAVAVGELGIFIDSLDKVYEYSLTAGVQALNERDQPQAELHFNEALTIKPESEEISRYLARASVLPELNRLLREADRAVLREDYEEALRYLTEAQEIDFETPDIASRLAVIEQKIAERSYTQKVGQAYNQLNEGNIERARTAFESLLEQNPTDSAALTGLAETERLQTSERIKALSEQIDEQLDRKDYVEAIKLYDEVLELNPDLQFARQGKVLLERLVTSHTGLDFILDDPYRLSLNQEYDAAKKLLVSAREVQAHDADLQEKVTKVEGILEAADREVPLVLISDNVMEIRLTNVGYLEPFKRLELKVRPGRYVVHGSRFGCRDVRKTVIVTDDMAPITIMCENPI